METALRQWWSSLAHPPEPLSRGQSLAVWIVSLVTALSRLPALSKTLWDLDESLFMAGMRKYDVTVHHPHPPGFPIFIGAAKIFSVLGLSDFHALQAVVLLTAMAIVPAVFFLGREARFGAETSLSAAALYAFLPNVWVFGGTAFSDIPATVLVILAVALLLRGCRSGPALLLGGLLFGISIGIRPQNLVIGAAAAAVAIAWCVARHRRLQICGAVALAALAAGGSYGVAAWLSHGLPAYLAAVHAHSEYILRVDSFHNPTRTPIWPLLGDMLAHPFQSPEVNVPLDILWIAGLAMAFVRRRIPSFLMIATFGPFFFGAWLYLDNWGMSRFSTAYLPLFTFLAADALSFIFIPVRRAIVVAIVVVSIVWTWPALRELYKHPSPPAAAAAWLRTHQSASATIWTHISVLPQMDVLLQGFHVVSTGNAGPPKAFRAGDVYVREGDLDDGIVFARPRKRLEGLVRDRFFEVTVVPFERFISYGGGWYQEEHAGATSWRWMGNRADIQLPPLGKAGVLTLDLYVPLDSLRLPPTIEVRLDGTTIDRFVPQSANARRTYTLPPARVTDVELSTTETIEPPGDPRRLGIRLNSLDWSVAKK